MRDAIRWMVLSGVLVAVTGCATTYTSAALGRYELYEPYARMRANSMTLELASGGYVAVIQVLTPLPSRPDRPIVFRAVYPRYPSDQRQYAAGTHRLRATPTFFQPWICGERQLPSLTGCRRQLNLLPGVRTLDDYRAGTQHYLAIVADEPIDPFTIAEELFYAALENPLLTRQLRDLDADLAAATLEQVLLDRPGSPNWAAHYVTAR